MIRIIISLVVIILLPFSLGGCLPAGFEATLVLEDFAAGDGPSLLKKTTPEPARKAITFTFDTNSYQGDIYHPAEKPLAAIVLIPGAAVRGKDDYRLVMFAYTLARARFMVLVPDIPNLRDLKVSPSDTRYVIAAVSHIVRITNQDQHLPLGIGAFSYAVGPAILASMTPQINHHVDFILAVGGYHDLNQVVTFFTTGYFQVNDRWQYLKPNEYGKWVFVRSNLDRLPDPVDRAIFQKMVDQKLIDSTAAIDDLAVNLRVGGKALYKLLTNRDPHRVPGLISKLPFGIRNTIDQLNLANKDLGRIKAHLLLIHGRSDPIIPYAQSISLAATLPPEQVDLFVIEGLVHVGVASVGIDRQHLWQAVNALLDVRSIDE